MKFNRYLFFALFATVVLVGCNKDEEEDEPEEEPIPQEEVVEIDDLEIFKGTIDGEEFSYEDITNNCSAYPAIHLISDDPANSIEEVAQGGVLIDWDTDDTLGAFVLGTIELNDGLSTKQVYYDLFSVGTHPYAENGDNGVIIYYSDDQGTLYSSDWGSANQSGSSFEITEVIDDVWLGDPALRVLAEFNCKVYDSQGNAKTIIEGTLLFEVLMYALD